MKKLLFIAFVLISTFAKAQDTLYSLPEIGGKVFYEFVVDVPGKSKDFIFNAANNWMLNLPYKIKGRIENKDKDQGQILGKIGFKLSTRGNLLTPGAYSFYSCTVQIDCKDNKYRIRLFNMYYGGADFDDKTASSLDDYNEKAKTSKKEFVHQNIYDLNVCFRGISASSMAAITKAAKDDF